MVDERTGEEHVTSPIHDTARETIANLAARKISARELLGAQVARNGELASTLNCVVATDLEQANRTAQAIDDARTRGAPLGALAGLPMTIKDVFDVEGMPAVVGHPALRDRAKTCADADLVACVKKENAVIWGKTNVPLMASDFQSYNDVYGTTNNPYDVTRTPGGSSGGAAVALATGITALELGSDIGGSLRHPANFCGVFSLKPTWGALTQRGHVPPLPEHFCDIDLNVVGPMARNAGDLRMLWNVLRGNAGSPQKDIEGARVILWDEEPGFPLARDVRAHVQHAADALQRHGAIIEKVKLPVRGDELMDTYLELLMPIIAASYPDALYESFLSGREADLRALRDGSGDVIGARFRLRSTASYREVLRAMTKRQAMKDKLAIFFDGGVDVILCPLGPVPAFKHSQDLPPTERTLEVDGATVPYMSLLTWIALATALHLPAMAIPAGQNTAGIPIGVQMIGPWHSEDRLFDFAYALEEDLGGFKPPKL
jgi:amidase